MIDIVINRIMIMNMVQVVQQRKITRKVLLHSRKIIKLILNTLIPSSIVNTNNNRSSSTRILTFSSNPWTNLKIPLILLKMVLLDKALNH